LSIPLVILAAGLSTRYGRLKQLDPLGPNGETIVDYNVFDAVRAGFDRVIMITRPEIEEALREHADSMYGGTLEVSYVHQTLDQLPEGFRAPPDRVRPWGTGHAVLCAAAQTDGPFAVCNADDHYGPGAFASLFEHLSAEPQITDAAIIGYTLDETLSGSGGVARAVCVLQHEGLLSQISEVRQIRRVDSWITGTSLAGDPLEFTGNEIVSMNLWGFTQPVAERMARQFKRFLGTWAADTRQEFFLSMAVSGQIQVGATSVAVLQAEDDWFGVTHADDREAARQTLSRFVSEGSYPDSLAAAFAALS
jgi:MobA-like NTP transferase protein